MGISDLPEDLIQQHILPFIDTKLLVQLSIISKQHRCLWLSTPYLNFDHTLWSETTRFNNFVDNVLALHSNYNVTKFSISCVSKPIDNWIVAAAKRHARELYIYTSKKEKDLKFYIYTSSKQKSLLTLSSLDHLKILNITSATLPYNANKDLIMSCPVLENLILRNCEHGEQGTMKTLTISLPKLKNLVIENDDEDWNKRIGSCIVEISTPRLITFRCVGRMYKKYVLKDVSSLVSAEIELRVDHRSEDGCFQLIGILKMLSHASLTLKLCHWSYEVLFKFADVLEKERIPLQNIRCLMLIIWWSKGSCVRPITKLLRAFPYIETIVLELDEVNHRITNYDRDTEFDCNFDHLKTVDIREVTGVENELKLLEIVTKNATFLEKVSVGIHKTLSYNKEEQAIFTKKIKSLHRASPNVDYVIF